MSIKCHFDQITTDRIAGWAWDPDMPAAPVVVELFDGDDALGTIEATQHRSDLDRARYRDGYCAFSFRCPPDRRITDPTRIRGIFRNSLAPQCYTELRGTRSDDGVIDFGQNPLPILRPLGLSLDTLRGQRQLGLETRLEPPIVVQAKISNGAPLTIGAFTGIYGESLGCCSFGRYCSVGPSTVIGPREHPVNWLSTSIVAEAPWTHEWDAFVDPTRTKDFRATVPVLARPMPKTTIGNDVWFGQGAFVRAGVTIGDGAVIGARAVVVGDIPPYSIAVGNPARIKRLRFPEPIVERLLKLRWWRYSLYDLMGTPFDQIEAALDAIEERIARGDLSEYKPAPYTVQRLREALSGTVKSS